MIYGVVTIAINVINFIKFEPKNSKTTNKIMRSKINILGSPVNNCEDSIVSQLKEDKKNVKRLKKDDNRSDNKTNINHVIIEKIGPQFLDGVTKLTYVPGYNGDYIRFDEIIQKNQLKSAFFCAMTIEFSWLLENLPKNISIVVAKHWDPENGDSQGVFCIPNTNILLVHPPMSSMGHGCFHAKLMILIYDEWIRVVISSANLISHDWEISENIVFIQDFPRYNENNIINNDLHLFAKELKDYLLAMGLKSHIIDKLPQYDYSKAKAIIIPSIPGAYKGIDDVKKYGHGRLSQIVKNICEYEDVELECQSSSLGSITPEFLNEFYRSAKGLDPYIIPKQRKSKRDKEQFEENESPGPSQPSQPSQSPQALQQPQPLPPITIVFPTNKTVLNSKYTFAGAGPLCFSKKCYEQITFPKEILRKCESNRNGILMHTKFLLARFIRPSPDQLEEKRLLEQEQNRQIKINKRKIIKNKYDSDESATDSDVADVDIQETITEENILDLSQDTVTDDVHDVQGDNNIVGWYYCGSHNFTESAWGKLNVSRDTKEIQLKIYNWELGIFLPITKLRDDDDKENNIGEQRDWFRDHGVPVSYKRPPNPYEESDIPWFSLGW
ncbi:uncharacterized protein OCT59_015862 [Rhizophagus irregularis]|uniref:uncharacterized protein n=1 Tax=Rhizophagus irregularis TaxID=588596 RepID=UPI000CA9DDCF|nr:hypothetical protein OCT59_015862 [Rhizophagus irregularis]GBC30703.1 phospholipase D/nuclease [Rhizophagus irregularis DAOM 181602=DAOM 197198]CAB4492612.1 unnamed protein product [Rhizophagus irregularis]CAB5195571.1 unnamed protein product [Rhizophagus irregularis]